MRIDFDACYRAVTSRDARFDGRFYTAVTSTGIYCRPSCPARTPAPGRVRFYPHAAAAEAAGFRPCRRCRPEASPGTPGWDVRGDLTRRALALIDDGVVDDEGVGGLARRLAVSERHLRRVVAAELGAGPLAIARTRRAHLAKRLLDDTDLPMTQVAFAAGYSSVRQFNAHVQAVFDRSPGELRERAGGHGPSETLRLAFRPPLATGPLLGFLRAHAVPGVEEVVAGRYRRVVGGSGGPGVVEAELGRESVRLRLRACDPRALGALAARLRRLLDLDADVAAAERVLAGDALLAPLVARHRGVRLPGSFDGFETAVLAVLGQQVAPAAARTLAGRLVSLAGEPLGVADGTLTAAFPTPAAVSGAPLERLGMPRRRSEAVRGIARAVEAGDLSFEAAPADVTAALRRVPGVGAWTAAVVALRVFGDPDILPAGDAVMRRALGGASPAAVRARAQAWRPWRSYATVHLWSNEHEEHRDAGAECPDPADPRRALEPAGS